MENKNVHHKHFCPHAWRAAGKPCKNGSHFVHDGGGFDRIGDPVPNTWDSYTVYNRWDAAHTEYMMAKPESPEALPDS